MNILISMLIFGFGCGLKTAGSTYPESNKRNISIGFSMCLLILLSQLMALGSGHGEIFWIVFSLVIISAVFLTLSIFMQDKEALDVIGIIFFILAFVMVRISALTIFVGVALITLFYPMAMSYANGHEFLPRTRRSLVRVIVIAGLVAFWFFMKDVITIDVLDILNRTLDIL